MNDRLERDTLVELQDQYSNVYPLSPTGARGWVRAKRELPKLEPEIFIEWDKNHWRYHGEPDGWTFEHHFRPVDDRLPDSPSGETLGDPILDPKPSEDFMSKLLAEAHRKVASERCDHCGGLHEEPSAFINTLMQAQDAALGSDGYLIIALTPRREDGFVFYEPEIFMDTLTSAARGVIEGQIALLAAQLFEGYVVDRVNDAKRPPDEPRQ